MPVARCTVRLDWTTPDVRGPLSSNTFHFRTAGLISPSTLDGPLDALQALYETGLDGIWGSMLSGEGSITCYNLADPKPRIPQDERAITITPEGTTLPTECAINLGFRAAPQLGVPKQRFRGRVMAGPLAQAAIDQNGHITAGVLASTEAALTTFATNVNGALDWEWVVGSEAQGWQPVSRVTIPNEVATVGRRQNTRSSVASFDL
jgi:hypothetical protein